MKNQRNVGKGTSSLLLLAALTMVAVAIATLATIGVTNATTIDIPDPVLELEEPTTNATETRQMIVRPDDEMPANGTVTLPMTEAEDVDFKGLVPEGISVLITNQSVTVTNQPIEQPGVVAETAAAPTAAPTPAPAPAEEDTSSNSEEDEE